MWGCIGRTIVFLGVLLGLIASGIAIYEFVFKEEELSFLEQTAGAYSLYSWTAASRPIELGAKVTDGTLQVRSDGTMDWTAYLEQTFVRNPGKVKMTARGKIQLDSKKVIGVKGGEFNNTLYLDSRWGQVNADVSLAVRGWNSGSPNDEFILSLDTQSNGRQLLQMRNSRGTFHWLKR